MGFTVTSNQSLYTLLRWFYLESPRLLYHYGRSLAHQHSDHCEQVCSHELCVARMITFIYSIESFSLCQTKSVSFYLCQTIILVSLYLYQTIILVSSFPAVFLTFGLSGIIPAVHYTLIEGFDYAITRASLGWLILMGALYVLGALLYAVRVPERFFPGKCDLWVSIH